LEDPQDDFPKARGLDEFLASLQKQVKEKCPVNPFRSIAELASARGLMTSTLK